MKQLKNRADEDARMIHMSIQMGNEPPISLRRDLEHLMLLVSHSVGEIIFFKNLFSVPLFFLNLGKFLQKNSILRCFFISVIFFVVNIF